MAAVRPIRRYIWWALIQRALTVALVLALTIIPVAGHNSDGHSHSDQAAAQMTVDSDAAKAPNASGIGDNCHISGSCSVLAIPQADFVWAVFAQAREVFGSEVLHWLGVVMPPNARPPII